MSAAMPRPLDPLSLARPDALVPCQGSRDD
jgi:hypothetical protein